MYRTALAILLSLTSTPLLAANVTRTYAYYSVYGSTPEAIERDIDRRGPKVKSTGRRHPGATELRFSGKVTYSQTPERCAVDKVAYDVRAKVVLPKWRSRSKADEGLRVVWDTLASDIRRHEESHIVIARTHARDIEIAASKVRPRKTCAEVEAEIDRIAMEILARHDKAQAKFDEVEAIGFENRIQRLIEYRIRREGKASD